MIKYRQRQAYYEKRVAAMKKIAIVYGEYRTGVQKKAVEVLSEFILDYTLEYPVCFRYEEGADLGNYRCIYIGTRSNNAVPRRCWPLEMPIKAWKRSM